MKYLLLILITTIAYQNVKACSVPVFRYALERWEASYYNAVIFTDKELSKDDKQYIKKISDEIPINLSIDISNIKTEKDENLKKQYIEHIKNVKLPAMLLSYPASYRDAINPPFWIGEYSKESLVKIVGSPAREKIVKNILKGDSAVWVIIESGDKEKDSKYKKILDTNLRKLEKELELPEGVVAIDSEEAPMDPADRLQSGIPLKLAFSTVSISRKELKEDFFLKMLLDFEPSLKGKLNGTVAIPVIGQGRAVFPLADDEINEENIYGLSEYITGSCSCEIKAQNPGMDLIFAISWYDVVDQTIGDEDIPVELGGLSEFPTLLNQTTDKSLVIKEGLEKVKKDKIQPKEDIDNFKKNIIITIILLLLVVSIVSIKVMKKKEDIS